MPTMRLMICFLLLLNLSLASTVLAQQPTDVITAAKNNDKINAINVQFLRRSVVGQKVHVPQYVGSNKCRECHISAEHGNQYINWLSSSHAIPDSE